MDKERFLELCVRFTGAEREREGIGTLAEKTLHLILKHYFEPNDELHEVKVGRKVADIRSGDHIIEIQTRNFNLLRPKLTSFLKDHKVTVVFPVAKEKYISWIDPVTGETTPLRKSGKKGSAVDIFPELYKIKMFLLDPGISFRIVLLGVNEYRLRNGWSEDGKLGSYKFETIPVSLFEEIEINDLSDYKKLIPEGLPVEFTSKDFAKTSKRTVYRAQTALNVLNHVGAVERVSRSGKGYRYIIKK